MMLLVLSAPGPMLATIVAAFFALFSFCIEGYIGVFFNSGLHIGVFVNRTGRFLVAAEALASLVPVGSSNYWALHFHLPSKEYFWTMLYLRTF